MDGWEIRQGGGGGKGEWRWARGRGSSTARLFFSCRRVGQYHNINMKHNSRLIIRSMLHYSAGLCTHCSFFLVPRLWRERNHYKRLRAICDVYRGRAKSTPDESPLAPNLSLHRPPPRPPSLLSTFTLLLPLSSLSSPLLNRPFLPLSPSFRALSHSLLRINQSGCARTRDVCMIPRPNPPSCIYNNT